MENHWPFILPLVSGQCFDEPYRPDKRAGSLIYLYFVYGPIYIKAVGKPLGHLARHTIAGEAVSNQCSDEPYRPTRQAVTPTQPYQEPIKTLHSPYLLSGGQKIDSGVAG